MGVVDIAGEEHASMHPTPVTAHLFAVLAASVEIRYLVSSKDIMHVLSELGFQRSHNSELLAHEDLGEQFMCTGEYHCLLLEVFNMGALSQELRHVVNFVACFLRETVTGSGKYGGAYKHRNIRELSNKFLHKRQVLCTIILGRYMNLQESNINIAQVIIVALGRVADEKFAFWVVVF